MAWTLHEAFLIRGRSDAQLKRVTREAFLVALGQAGGALGGVVGVRLLTHALSPATYGELALGMTVATLAQQTALLPIAVSVLRFFSPALEARQLRAFVGATRSLVLKAAVFIGAIAAVLSLGLWSVGLAVWAGLVLGAAVFSLLSGYGAVLDGMQAAARRRVIVGWHETLGQWLRFLAAVGFVKVLGTSSGVAMAGYATASAIVLGSQVAFFKTQLLESAAREKTADQLVQDGWRRHVRDYGWPFSAWGMFTWAYLSSDRWALQWFATAREVGLYAVVFQLGYYPMMLLGSWMGQLLAPVLFSVAGDGSDASRLQRARHLSIGPVFFVIAATVAGAALTAVFHEDIFALLVAPQFRGVSALLPVLVLSGGTFAAAQVMALALMVETNSQMLLAPKAGTAVVGVALNIVGARWLGLQGVAASGVAFSFIYLGWVALLVRQRLRPTCW
jgi:O-antigen/teichoic acid export membrane protein